MHGETANNWTGFVCNNAGIKPATILTWKSFILFICHQFTLLFSSYWIISTFPKLIRKLVFMHTIVTLTLHNSTMIFLLKIGHLPDHSGPSHLGQVWNAKIICLFIFCQTSNSLGFKTAANLYHFFMYCTNSIFTQKLNIHFSRVY